MQTLQRHVTLRHVRICGKFIQDLGFQVVNCHATVSRWPNFLSECEQGTFGPKKHMLGFQVSKGEQYPPRTHPHLE